MKRARHIMIINSKDGPTAIYTTGITKRDIRSIAAVSAAIAATVTGLILCIRKMKK